MSRRLTLFLISVRVTSSVCLVRNLVLRPRIEDDCSHFQLPLTRMLIPMYFTAHRNVRLAMSLSKPIVGHQYQCKSKSKACRPLRYAHMIHPGRTWQTFCRKIYDCESTLTSRVMEVC